jgi:hypothetical protein
MRGFLVLIALTAWLEGCVDDQKHPTCPTTAVCSERRDSCFNRCDELYKPQGAPETCTGCCHSVFSKCENCEQHNALDCH